MGIQGFVNTWSSSYSSSENRMDLLAVRQGGNNFLSTGPLVLQSMWAGILISEVSAVVSGPLYAIAQLFRIVLNPLITGPLAFISCAVKEGFYESSVSCKAAKQIQHYKPGKEVLKPIKGTVTLNVNGQDRHFVISDNDINWWFKNTIEIEGKRHRFEKVGKEERTQDCREIEVNGKKTWVKIEYVWEKKFVQIEQNGEVNYYELEYEVKEPIQGTIDVGTWIDDDKFEYKHYLRTPSEDQSNNGLTIRLSDQTLFYDTGNEIDAPQKGSYTFTINGEERYFATAKYVKSKGLGVGSALAKITKHLTGSSFIPKRLSAITSAALRTFNQHLSEVVRIATLVTGVVCIYFGQFAMATGVIAAITYEYLNNDLGVIPLKVSLFMEQWMPTIAMVGLLITGSFVTQIIAATNLLFKIPSVQIFLQHSLSKGIRQTLIGAGVPIIRLLDSNVREGDLREAIGDITNYPYLEEFDAPLIQKKDLNFKEIQKILNAEYDREKKVWKDYEFNPAALTKDVVPPIPMEKNNDFNQLLKLWDAHSTIWTEKKPYGIILGKLVDDDRFIAFLQEQKFGHIKRLEVKYSSWDRSKRVEEYAAAAQKHRAEIQECISELAKRKNISKEQYAADWMREQLNHLVLALDGKDVIQGRRSDLRDTIENVSQIIPFVMNPNATPADLEDSLLKLAIEGGKYCALGAKRASKEVLQSLSAPLIEEDLKKTSLNQRPEKAFWRAFQAVRLKAVDGFFAQLQDGMPNSELTRRVMEDVHLYTAFSEVFLRTMSAMTEEKRNDYSLTQLLFGESVGVLPRLGLHMGFTEVMPEMMTEFGKDQTSETGNRVLDFLRNWIQNDNHQLSPNERQKLLNGPLSKEDVANNTNMFRPWQLLMLVVTGVFREKQQRS